jgi:FtsH-binding integral membrane protein
MTQRMYIKILLGLLIGVVLFHICILTKLISYEIVWGGRLQNDAEMYAFEAFSIGVNLLLGFILLVKGKFIKPYLKQKTVHVILWIFLFQFVLNTVGNIFAKTNLEKTFAVLTFVFAILIYHILKSNNPEMV